MDVEEQEKLDQMTATMLDSDKEYSEEVVTKVEPDSDGKGFTVYCGSSALWTTNENQLPLPEPGEKIRFYGKGMGFPVRGVVLVRKSSLVSADNAAMLTPRVYRYQTHDKFKAAWKAQQAKTKQDKLDAWERNKDKFLADVATLPQPFQDRIQGFLERRKNWGAEVGSYELFCCQEAIKTAAWLKEHHIDGANWGEEVKAFYDLPPEKHREAGLSNEHSSNTFGASLKLATMYLTQPPDVVVKMHGALCPLTGCDNYGCWASTEEAKAEKQA